MCRSLVSELPDPIFACSHRILEVDGLCFLQLSHIGNTLRMWICIICAIFGWHPVLMVNKAYMSVQNASNIVIN